MIQLVKTAENKGRASKSPSIIHVSFSINNEPLKATNQILSFLIAKMCHQPYLWMDAHAVPCTACVGVYGACTLEAHAGCRPRLKQETAALWLLAHSDRSGRIHIWYAPGHLGNALKKKKIPRCPRRKSGRRYCWFEGFRFPRINASLRLRARVVPDRRKNSAFLWKFWSAELLQLWGGISLSLPHADLALLLAGGSLSVWRALKISFIPSGTNSPRVSWTQHGLYRWLLVDLIFRTLVKRSNLSLLTSPIEHTHHPTIMWSSCRPTRTTPSC